MARTQRSRSRSQSFTGKIIPHLGPSETDPPGTDLVHTVIRSSSCTDWRGSPVVPSSFNSDQRSGSLFIDGTTRTSNRFYRFDSVPYTGGVGSVDASTIPAPNGWVLTLVARTNPSRSKLNPPEMLQNLIELPRMIRQAWKFFQHPATVLSPRGAANAHLGISFGWLPFIDDLNQLLNLQGLIDKRLKELKQLHSGRGLRRRLKFGDSSSEAMLYSDFPLLGDLVIRAQAPVKIQKTAWATIRWKPTEPPPYHPDDVRYRNDVRRVILGLTPEGLAKGLWAIIPWTWLIGWFTNIGDLLLANSNTIPATWGSACFMSMTSVITQPGQVSVAAGSVISLNLQTHGEAKRVVRTRLVGTASLPGLNMPFLDMFRLSILGALGIQRFRRLNL